MKEEKLGKILYEIFSFSVSIVFKIRQREFFLSAQGLYLNFLPSKNYNFKNKLLQLSYKYYILRLTHLCYIYFTLEFLYNFMF